MDEISRKLDVEKLISYNDELVQFLKNEGDINDLKHSVENPTHSATDVVQIMPQLKALLKVIRPSSPLVCVK